MPMCSDGVTDMFWPEPWDLKAIEEDCMKKYGVPPQPYHIEMLYGGKNISSHSNIIFRYHFVSSLDIIIYMITL